MMQRGGALHAIGVITAVCDLCVVIIVSSDVFSQLLTKRTATTAPDGRPCGRWLLATTTATATVSKERPATGGHQYVAIAASVFIIIGVVIVSGHSPTQKTAARLGLGFVLALHGVVICVTIICIIRV